MTFKTFGHIAAAVGVTEARVDVSGNTVQDFLHSLTEKFGERISKILYPKGSELSEVIYILVNGRNIRHLSGLQTQIKDGDIISVFPLTAGG